MIKVTLSENIGKQLLKGKPVYLVSKRIDLHDEIILETICKKEAYLFSSFQAKNKAELSEHKIVLTKFEKCGNGYSVSEQYINPKTLDKTINSKKFNK